MTQDITSAFVAQTVDWRSRLAADEWFFAKLRGSLVDTLTPNEAFSGVANFARLIAEMNDPELRYEAAVVLLSLARQSNTTEMPFELKTEWGKVASAFSSGQVSLLQELKDWYRVSEL
jgi:hypothetical protein